MPYAKFDYTLDYKNLDLRKQSELYRTGIGEQGVLLVEPYKSEILPYWKFKNPEAAAKSSKKIYQLFLAYKKQNDFIGMDMARKYLQMGVTRSRRYANHKSGRKYKDSQTAKEGKVLPLDPDPVKAKSAEIFLERLNKVKSDKLYSRLLAQHKHSYKM